MNLNAGVPPVGTVTALLRAWSQGEASALEELMPIVYAELRRRAAGYLRRERRDHTLEPTALVHEAFLRLLDQRQVDWQSRTHFVAVAASTMRRVLVDHARHRQRAKRGGGTLCRVTLEPELAAAPASDVDIVALDQALEQLQQLDAQQARLVELRFFGGLSGEEAAQVIGVSESTAKRDWRSARAFLLQRLKAAS